VIRVIRRGIFLSCTVALLLGVTDARADADTARQHFDAGKKLRDEGDCTRAIPEFTKSLDADKSIGGYYNLGFCHEQLGRRQEAYDAYRHAYQLASVKKDDRLREISGSIASLLETPHIKLVLPQPLPEGIQIRVDDQLVPESFYGTETVIFTKSAKTHAVSVTAPGYEERRETVESRQLRAIELRRPSEKTTPLPPVPPPKVESGGWTWQHWTGLGVGVLGAGLVTVASVILITYSTKESSLLRQFRTLDEKCKGAGCNDEERAKREVTERDYNANEQSVKDDTPLIAATGVGGVLVLGTGLVLFLTAPRSSSEAGTKPAASSVNLSPILTGRTRGLALTGTF
jgi:hypothetical protein